jgi:hypothetical protein
MGLDLSVTARLQSSGLDRPNLDQLRLIETYDQFSIWTHGNPLYF